MHCDLIILGLIVGLIKIILLLLLRDVNLT